MVFRDRDYRENETVDHLFFRCPIARYTWSVVACSVVSDRALLTCVAEICSWIKGFKGTGFQQVMSSGIAAVLWSLWKIRNRACFQNIYPVDPNVIILGIVRKMEYWSLLQKGKIRDRLRYGRSEERRVGKECRL